MRCGWPGAASPLPLVTPVAGATKTSVEPSAGPAYADLSRWVPPDGKPSPLQVWLANATAARQIVTELVICVLVVGLAVSVGRELRTDTLSVLPLQVPAGIADKIITPVGGAEVVAQAMADLAYSLSGVVSRPGAARVDLAGAGASPATADIEIPGESISFRSVVRVLERVLETNDVELDIAISMSAGKQRATLVARGGPYDGASRVIEINGDEPITRLLRAAGAAGLALTQPYIFARMLMDRYHGPTAEGRECPPTFDCGTQPAVRVLEGMLSNGVEDDDVWAHHGLVMAALLSKDAKAALRHCQAAIHHRDSTTMSATACTTSAGKMESTAHVRPPYTAETAT